MHSQREMVFQSILIPNHGVYPVRKPKAEPKVEPKAKAKERDEQQGKCSSPRVPKVDHGEW